jgi:leucine-rich repeat protein SHOC2
LANPAIIKALDASMSPRDSANPHLHYIDTLANLEELYLNNRNLDTLPFAIDSLEKLKILDLSGNPLKYFPEGFENLDSLEELNLSHMNLTEIPEFVYSMGNLKRLDLTGNSIKVIPKKIKRLENLETLRIGNMNVENVQRLPTWLRKTKIELN